jgi:hypothetical protein
MPNDRRRHMFTHFRIVDMRFSMPTLSHFDGNLSKWFRLGFVFTLFIT